MVHFFHTLKLYCKLDWTYCLFLPSHLWVHILLISLFLFWHNFWGCSNVVWLKLCCVPMDKTDLRFTVWVQCEHPQCEHPHCERLIYPYSVSIMSFSRAERHIKTCTVSNSTHNIKKVNEFVFAPCWHLKKQVGIILITKNNKYAVICLGGRDVYRPAVHLLYLQTS